MFIKKIELENYKSFLNRQTLTMGQKNLFVGKNGSGKSNLLNAISNIFLFTEDKNPQHNSNDEHTTITVEIDNRDKRFLLPLSFTIKMIYKDGVEFLINDRPISKDEYKGMLENAGLTKECFIMQGKINNTAMMSAKQRYSLICKIAGVEKYEESKAIAFKYLNEESGDKIESLIEKIEMKMKISDDYKKKAEEYDNFMKSKAEAEFELLNYEIRDLNDEIDKIVIEEQANTAECDENMVEYEIKACRDEINKHKGTLNDCEDYLNRFDSIVLEKIKSKLAETGTNPYDNKVNSLLEHKAELQRKLTKAEKEEEELYVELKGLKYFDAMGTQKEDIIVLEEHLKLKRQEVENYKTTTSEKDKYADLVNERKKLWNKEKQANDEQKENITHEKELENKILYLGKLSVNVFESLKRKNGVLGTVFSIFEVPDKFLDAYEAVCRNSLFWIVVENDDVATSLITTINERATFVALNRIAVQTKSKAIGNLVKLSEQIFCDKIFTDLLSMICKNFYIADDPQSALELSIQHNINIVTLDGDIYSKNGSITGGYEGSNQVLRELKKCKKSIKGLGDVIINIQKSLKDVNEKIKVEELFLEDDSRVLENLRGFIRYLEIKIEFIKKKKISLPEISDVEAKYNAVFQALPKVKSEYNLIDTQLSKATEKKQKVDEITGKLNLMQQSIQELERLKNKERSYIDSLYIRKANVDLENSYNIQKKHILIDKRSQLLIKIGISDFRAIHIKRPREQLTSLVKEINKSLKNYYGFTRNDVSDDQRLELKQRLMELKDSKSKILDFINLLDLKKEQTFNLSFSMISDNFSYFYKKFTGKNASLVLKDQSVDIVINISNSLQICDIQSLSGGQKTVVALCIIFAIQKNDPSPFYVFDEIDANLDMEHCLKLKEIITKSTSQYLISSFKAEMIPMAEKYFGVAVVDKQSFVAEISRDAALEAIIPEVPQ